MFPKRNGISSYDAGWNAGRSTTGATNPYPSGTAEASRWEEGHNDACASLAIHCRVPCPVCHQMHEIDRRTVGSAEWNVCLECVEREHQAAVKELAARGVILS